MVLRLDTRLSVVWRNPFDMQFGVEPTRVVLRDVSSAQERMIAALTAGVSPSGLTMIARAAGADDAEVPSLLERLSTVLEKGSPPRRKTAALVVGRGRGAERIARALAQDGHRVTVSATVTPTPCDVAVLVGAYVLDPDAYGFWLRRDIPHLPVLFGDTGATVGPMVEPGSGPCLYCLEHYRGDADAGWAAIASQLWGRRSPAETPLLTREVAARVARLVAARVADGATAVATSAHLPTDGGMPRLRTWLPHPQCGCIAVGAGASVSSIRPGTGSPGGTVHDATPLLPTSVRAASAHA